MATARPRSAPVVVTHAMNPGSAADRILNTLRTLAGQLQTSVLNQDSNSVKATCAQMGALVEILEALSIPEAAPELSNLKRHIRFPERYAPAGEWGRIGSDPTDCIRDIGEIEARVAAVGSPSQAWWSSLHPSVRAIAEPRWNAGHLADAVEAALKEVSGRVKREYKKLANAEVDGKGLMRAFSLDKKPRIELADLGTESGRSEQEGYMYLFGGAMEALRNPKAHANLRIDEGRALHHLFVASLLMSKLDEAGVPP